MPTTVPLRLAALALATGALLAPGCRAEKKVDRVAERLLASLRRGDYRAFRAASHAALVRAFGRHAFHRLHLAVGALGPLKRRALHYLHARPGGRRIARYGLRFARGEATLTLTVHRGKLVTFELSGDAVGPAARRGREREARQQTAALLDAARRGDAAAFARVASADLCRVFGSRRRATLARALASLGPWGGVTIVGVDLRGAYDSSGRAVVRLGETRVPAQVDVRSGRVIAFQFSGAAFQRAIAAAEAPPAPPNRGGR